MANNNDDFMISGVEERNGYPESSHGGDDDLGYENSDRRPGSIKSVLIAGGVGAILTGLVVFLVWPKSDDMPANIIDIPTISPGSRLPMKVMPGETGAPFIPPADVGEPEAEPAADKRPVAAPKPKAPAKKPVPHTVKVVPTKNIAKPKEPGVAEAKGPWQIQLMAAGIRENLESSYKDVVRKHQNMLANRPYAITEGKDNEGKTVYRLRLTGFATKDAAKDYCDKLKAYKLQCYVAR
jgi:cell division septation protein DedD